MPIERNAGGFGSFIEKPGEYRAKITEIKTGLSKSQKPMLTVTFQTQSELSIRSYFVKTLVYHMKSLDSLKVACGLKTSDPADNLVGKECGILVEAQKPDPDMGRVFMTITGYGPASEVVINENTSDFLPNTDEDKIPF